MYVFNVRNVSDALPIVLHKLSEVGVERDSQNGYVTKFSGPVTTKYNRPQERVMFHPERDCNPFFHLFESLWMLAGRNDVAWLEQFNSNISNYSDDKVTFHGAYGHRWIKHFHFDQLKKIIEALSINTDDHRCVLQMWDAKVDLCKQGKDFPCSLMAVFSVNDNSQLDMTVYNRSNDIVWGAYGANAVHFSMLQEYVAAALGLPMGKYWQVSNNLHAYKDTLEKVKGLESMGEELSGLSVSKNPYDTVKPYPMVSTSIKSWNFDLEVFMAKGPVCGLNDPFFKQVVTPLWWAWKAFKQKDDPRRFTNALNNAKNCRAEDWKLACCEWLQRREEKANAK